MSRPAVTNVRIVPNKFHIGDTISVTYTFTADPGKSETGTIVRWYRNNQYQKIYDNLKSFVVNGRRGDTWLSSITPCDGAQYGITVTSSNTGIMLNNLPSQHTYVECCPHNPMAGMDDLKVFYSGAVDPDGDRVLTLIKWLRNNIELPQYANKSVMPRAEVREGDVFKVEISTTDGYIDISLSSISSSSSFSISSSSSSSSLSIGGGP